ncbi:MAG: hypothetical protein HWN66_02555 [Candidatus Helarchaeota archaeon]|nr:hypothetical protein [Candidatus Helarchaeota archaeon]
MVDSMDSKPEKLTKRDKKERKKLDKATDRMEKEIEEKSYKRICIAVMGILDFLILIGVLLITSSAFSIVVVYIYVTFITLIALVPLMLKEYEQVGRKPPRIVRIFNSFLEKVFPINRKTMKIGPSILISHTFLITIGGFIAIVVYTFTDFLTQNKGIYSYLLPPGTEGEFGFFSFVFNSSSNSLMPSILWYLIVFIPVFFCFLFLIAALYFRNNDPSKLLNVVVFSPLMVVLPIFLSASSITSPSIVIALIFIAAWFVTLLIWYRQFTKRNAFIILSILFTQILASFLMIYGFIFYEVRDTSHYLSDPINISTYYNPLFLLLWFGVLISIPLIVKGFDLLKKGKLKILGSLFAVGVAVVFQIYFFNLFNTSIYNAYSSFTPTEQQAAEVFVGSGFFFFYIYLLIPLFFIFGYFQIGLARWLYRVLRDYGQKINRPTLLRITGTILTCLFIFGLVFVYYFILYSPGDYRNMFAQGISLFNGDLIYYLTLDPATIPATIPLKDYQELLQISSLAITMGLLAYSSYRGAYNLALFKDKIDEPDIKRLGIFNFIIFTSPRSYKTRILFGISLIFLFLGISTIFTFLKIHTVLFDNLFSSGLSPSVIIFATFDGFKLGVSIIGMGIAIAIFFYFLFERKTK